MAWSWPLITSRGLGAPLMNADNEIGTELIETETGPLASISAGDPLVLGSLLLMKHFALGEGVPAQALRLWKVLSVTH